MKKNLLCSVIILALYCGQTTLLNAMQNKHKAKPTLTKNCLIKNTTAWNLKVETENLGFTLILRPNQSQSISTQGTITIVPYGEFWGLVTEKFLEKKIISINQLNSFQKPLMTIIPITTAPHEPTTDQTKQSWAEWTVSKIADTASAITEKAQELTGLQDYELRISEAQQEDRPTLYELLAQSSQPRFFLKLVKEFKPEEINPAAVSLINNNISTLPDGTLKTVLTELANTAANILLNSKPQDSIKQWVDALEKAHKELGKEIACLITNNKPLSSFDPAFNTPDKNQKNRIYKEFIIDLMWHLYAIAENKHQAFTEGTFVLIGSAADDVQKFLMDYVMLVNPAQQSPISPTQPSAYPRISSHFKQHSFEHYGIDVGSVLPENKQHILFGSIEPVLTGNFSAEELTALGGTIKAVGRIDSESEPAAPINRSFIKLENYGLSVGDIAGHTFEFLDSLKTKAVAKYTGTSADDDPLYRKERIPMEFKKTIAAILEEHPYPENGALRDEFNELGFQFLIAQIIQIPQNLPQDLLHAFLKYANTLRTKEKKEIYDSLNLRFGREVIILEKDFCPPQELQKPQKPVLKLLKTPDTSTVPKWTSQDLEKSAALKNVRAKIEKEQAFLKEEQALLKEEIKKATSESPLSPLSPTISKSFSKNVVSSPYFQQLIQKMLKQKSPTSPNQPVEKHFTDWEIVEDTAKSSEISQTPNDAKKTSSRGKI